MNTKEFFKKMYEHCDSGQIEIRELPKARTQFFDLEARHTIDTVCVNPTNYFFGVALRNGGGTKESITQIPSLWADIDFKDIPREVAKKQVGNFPFKPSIAVESGNGIHLYWLLKEPCEHDQIDEFEKANRNISQIIGADIASSEAARILRIPGTKNYKYKPARNVNLLYINKYYYNIYDVLEFIENTRSNQLIIRNTKQHQATSNNAISRLSFSEGSRDNDLFHTATCLSRGGMHEDNIPIVLNKLASVCTPPFPQKETGEKIKSVIKRSKNSVKNLAHDIRQTIATSNGIITTSFIHKEHQMTSPDQKKKANSVLYRLEKEGLLEKTGRYAGEYRILDNDCEPEDWLNAPTDTCDINLPFGLGDMVHIMPGDIILFSGVPGVGKTAVLLNTAISNLDHYNVHYFSSELRPGTFKRRISKLETTTPEMLKGIKFYQRYENYHDVIKSGEGNLNVIDYVKVLDNFYIVGKIFADIAKKLQGAVAVVSLQKQFGSKTGIGGMFSQFEPVLSVNLDRSQDYSVATISKTKEYKEDYIAQYGHADGFEYHFKIVNGIRLLKVRYWHKPFNG